MGLYEDMIMVLYEDIEVGSWGAWHGCPPDEVRGRLYEDITMGLYEDMIMVLYEDIEVGLFEDIIIGLYEDMWALAGLSRSC